MKKHLIIHGDSQSGKTLFVKALLKKYFSKKKTWDCRNLSFIDDEINRKYFELNQAVFFMDVNVNISVEYFYQYATIPNGSKIIVEYSEELKNLPDEATFTRRFDVINTNTISYKDLINFLNTK